MSKLEFYARPWTAFNPANKQHREWYHEFVNHKTWGGCPVRFICPDDSGSDLTVMIRNQLIQYYVMQEFGKKRGRPKLKKPVN
jgi:hypothetical protein